MKAKAITSSALLVIGGVVFSTAHAQTATETATISATGAVSNNNGWISSVSVNNHTSSSGGETSYVLNFAGAAPGATSCNVMPATSGLNSRMTNPVNMLSTLVVSFTPSVPNESAVGGAATGFTLTCTVASAAPNPNSTTTAVTSPALLQGTQSASISSTAAVTHNNGWITSATFTGTGYPSNAYIVEFAGRSPGASNCVVNPATVMINGYAFTGGLYDGSDGTSVMIRYAPPANTPGGATIPAALPFVLTCTFPSS
jgi:hypothetical protein